MCVLVLSKLLHGTKLWVHLCGPVMPDCPKSGKWLCKKGRQYSIAQRKTHYYDLKFDEDSDSSIKHDIIPRSDHVLGVQL